MRFSKKLKKISALVLAVAMVAGLFVTGNIGSIASKAADAVDGYSVTTPDADTTYIFDFIKENKVSPNKGTYGLFSFDAGNSNAASYRGDKYGVEFKVGNKLTFNVAGNCYVSLTGDNNSKGTLVATASNGTLAVDSKSAVTANYCSADDCVAMGDNAVVFDYTGGAGTVTIEVTENKAYINSAAIIPKATLDTSKIDAWDFGAEALDASIYNNNLTVDVANACYPGVDAGSTSKNIASFTLKDAAGNDAVKFEDGGYATTHRWRTKNTAITRYDEKDKKDADKVVYNGFIYSNKGSTDAVYMSVYMNPGDKTTLWLGSNGNAATYEIAAPDGKVTTFEYTKAADVEPCTIYGSAAESGWYKVYCTNEKLVCARIIRQHMPLVTVSGSVSAPDKMPSGYGIKFTNKSTGAVTVAKVENGSYSAKVYGGYDYDIALDNANGFVVSSDSSATVATEDTTIPVEIKAVDLIELQGKITGIDSADLAKLDLKFTADKIYIPELTVDAANLTYALKVESGVEYALTANGVNDYTLDTTSVKYVEAGAGNDIAFTKKPVYPVNVEFIGDADVSGAQIIFTNINEAGYVYSISTGDSISLRDGQYKVTVVNHKSRAEQGPTADVKVNGAATVATIPMAGERTVWDIAKLAADGTKPVAIDDASYFFGLKAVGSVATNQNKYLLLKGEGSSITIPALKAGDTVTLKYCYEAGFKVGDEIVDEKSGSTSKVESKSYTLDEDKDFVIEGIAGEKAGQAYFTEIRVTSASSAQFKSYITVGVDKEYKTINEALAAVRQMSRPNDEYVTIAIDPGNYEEMLVIDVPNVNMVNASATPSTALKNKGVDIDENAVRITWYYGHGYTYYSMDSDCKYNADLLAANISNGYASFVNPGSGTTNGSYWNATVVISATGFRADGIIFENSFNQYVSAKSVEDVIVAQASAKEGSVKRAEMKTVGDTKLQEKEYVERAAALSIYSNVDETVFYNCKFIGRQDTLYGGVNSKVSFDSCQIYGGTDYIFGGMIAVFNKCDLVFNTNDQTDKGKKDDVGYITAPQQSSGRGYLFLSCHVTSTTPGVDTASEHTSKPGYWGRPWQANTSEAVFVDTKVDAADPIWSESGSDSLSLIAPAGWLSSLSGESNNVGEYNTIEASGVDNSASRVAWAKVYDSAVTTDGASATIETFFGDWQPFNYYKYEITEGKDVKVEVGSAIVAKIEAAYKKFERVFVDGKMVDASNYVVTEGSTVITFTEEFSKSLAVGEHNLKVEFVDGITDEVSFIVTEAQVAPVTPETPVTPAAPSTGDATPIALYVIVMLGAAGVVLTSKKRRSVR